MRYANRAIRTSGLIPVGISLGTPRFRLDYRVEARVRDLAPDRSWFNAAKEEFEELYRPKLDRFGTAHIRRLLEGIHFAHGSRGLVLLCFEDLRKPGASCHRRDFAAWWLEQIGQEIPELEALG
jgi:hypothetical protein